MKKKVDFLTETSVVFWCYVKNWRLYT